ncbi:MAG TPA: hypothetical protein PKA98_12975 [Acidimicrobiales bacterium]|nr:hypothetical protein [Acidimicrobiales bacterium]
MSPWWATPPDPPPALEEVYDAATLAALDSGVEPERDETGATEDATPTVAAGWRGSLAGGAVLAGIALGLKQVFDPEPDGGAMIEVVGETGAQPVDGVTLHFVPDDPQATVAVVRRAGWTPGAATGLTCTRLR